MHRHRTYLSNYPRARGARAARRDRPDVVGIIPACAGSTLNDLGLYQRPGRFSFTRENLWKHFQPSGNALAVPQLGLAARVLPAARDTCWTAEPTGSPPAAGRHGRPPGTTLTIMVPGTEQTLALPPGPWKTATRCRNRTARPGLMEALHCSLCSCRKARQPWASLRHLRDCRLPVALHHPETRFFFAALRCPLFAHSSPPLPRCSALGAGGRGGLPGEADEGLPRAGLSTGWGKLPRLTGPAGAPTVVLPGPSAGACR